MQAEGREETTTEYEINGVRVSVVDRAELSSSGSGATATGGPGGGVGAVRHVREEEGVRVMVVDEQVAEEEGEGEGMVEEGNDDGDAGESAARGTRLGS